MRILVTGACGFIGSHLVEKLVKQNYSVKAFTFYNARGSNGWLDNVDRNIIKNLEIVSGENELPNCSLKTTVNIYI